MMKDLPKSLCVSLVLVLLGCHSDSKLPASTAAADEAAVRQTDDNWSKAAQSKKLDDWMAFYSDDAIVLPPNEQKVDSKEGIRKEIGTLLGAPGLSLHWTPTKVEVAGSGDLAYTQGSYELTMPTMHTANPRQTMGRRWKYGKSRPTAAGNA
jgi:ketosteroid isomerase-like protein